MRYTEISVIDVTDTFVDNLWDKVKDSGSFYSIGDGSSKECFRRVFFESSLVLKVPGGFARFNVEPSFVELHPIIFGPELYRNARSTLEGICELARESFQGKPIRCIIPSRMKGLKRLAVLAGMEHRGACVRPLSGVPISCEVYEWRA